MKLLLDEATMVILNSVVPLNLILLVGAHKMAFHGCSISL
jgi:hypothetical protein